jgi:hypothetical protein
MKRKGSKAGRSSPTGVCVPVPPTRAVGAPLKRGYTTDDRFLQTLILALCRPMDLVAYRDDGHAATLVVEAPDEATHDRLEQRVGALSVKLDDQLMALTTAFIREHCGLDVPIRPRT